MAGRADVRLRLWRRVARVDRGIDVAIVVLDVARPRAVVVGVAIVVILGGRAFRDVGLGPGERRQGTRVVVPLRRWRRGDEHERSEEKKGAHD